MGSALSVALEITHEKYGSEPESTDDTSGIVKPPRKRQRGAIGAGGMTGKVMPFDRWSRKSAGHMRLHFKVAAVIVVITVAISQGNCDRHKPRL